MNVSFHTEHLGLRGVEVSVYDYAKYNEEILNNTSIIFSQKNGDLKAYDKFSNRFEVVLYEDFKDLQFEIDKRNIEVAYFQKAGKYDGKILKNCKNVVHSVFQLCEPHGDVYGYISEWLTNKMTNGKYPFVPYIVDILNYDNNLDYREVLNIPKDAMVYAYYGGNDSFSIPFAKKAVYDIAKSNKNIYFLFMNVDVFCEELENILHIEGTHNFDKKISFINTCDACIHARNGGESFGLTVAEFSVKNKPVITSTYGTLFFNDLAHTDMLKDKAIIYNDYSTLINILTNLSKYDIMNKNWNAYTEYTPSKVMSQFKQKFL